MEANDPAVVQRVKDELRRRREEREAEFPIGTRPCPNCLGTGEQGPGKCPYCKGKGWAKI